MFRTRADHQEVKIALHSLWYHQTWWSAHVFETCIGMKYTYCKTKSFCIKRVNYWDKYTESNKTPTWCNTVQVLFLQSQSTCFGRERPSPGVFKTGTAATGTCVIVAGKSSHHLFRALIRWCDDLPATITHVPVAAVPVLNTSDDVRLRPKHVEWLCRNKTCTVLHQVGVLFDLYYDARKHKIKIYWDYTVRKTSKLYVVVVRNGIWRGAIVHC